MKKNIVLILMLFEINTMQGIAQKIDDKSQTRMESSLEALVQAADSGNNDAVLELGKRGEREITPILQKIREKNKNKAFGSVSSCAQMALAKLGDSKATDEILAELKSDEPMSQDNAIKKLTYVANNKAIEILISLLENNSPRKMKGYDSNMRGPKGEMPQGKILYEPINVIAMKALATIIPNPIISANKLPSQGNIQKWREWWQVNSNKYCRAGDDRDISQNPTNILLEKDGHLSGTNFVGQSKQ